jgi:hypothetical protein
MFLYYLMTFAEAVLGVVGIRGLYEQPPYAVVRPAEPGGIELRDYPARVAAETDDDGRRSAAFERLFRYITGANAAGERVAMTAPVQQTARGELIAMTVPVQSAGRDGSAGVMRFFLPAKVAAEGPPAPTDPLVRIATAPAQRVAVLRFSGVPSGARVAEKKRTLAERVAAAGLSSVGEPFLLTYDAPFTLPFLRRNEVAVEVAK